MTKVFRGLFIVQQATDTPLVTPEERAKARLGKLHLCKALRICRKAEIPLASLAADIDSCIEQLFIRKAYGEILSAYYEAGVVGRFSVDELLQRIFEKKDYPTFLKQAYRFNAYQTFARDIDEAIGWHFARNLPDSEAWRRKFTKLQEQDHLAVCTSSNDSFVKILDERDVETTTPPTVFRLTPIKRQRRLHADIRSELPDEPYIISQAARVKTEQANALHRETLSILQTFLETRYIRVLESRLIDTYAFIGNRPAIFEIKSISESNERTQIRHAISQLYEYRFLHAVPDASLWVVFSQEPLSQWYIDYLSTDRGICVLWVHGQRLAGPSLNELNRLCAT